MIGSDKVEVEFVKAHTHAEIEYSAGDTMWLTPQKAQKLKDKGLINYVSSGPVVSEISHGEAELRDPTEEQQQEEVNDNGTIST